jgi:transaldolase
MNSSQELRRLGQSIWLDYIRRDLITSGQLRRLIEDDGISGITSNPTIFAKAIAGDSEYDSILQRILEDDPKLDSVNLFEKIEIEDLKLAADELRPVYDRTAGDDGYVSIEISPSLAYDTQRSVDEARRLWAEVDRPNLFVKIPATFEGMPAIEQLTAEGINVNVTLMFSVSQYEQVAEAYLRGIQRNPNPQRVRSVASFFVSRVDTAVDKALEEIGTEEALALRGKAGIANARLAYRRFREVFFSRDFENAKARGVHLQKPLWASTSTKNKAYSDVMYIEGLIGPHTINSMPLETIEAFRDHGKAQVTLGENHQDAEEVVGRLLALEINLMAIGQELTEEGVDKFIASHEEAIRALEQKRGALRGKAA